MEEEKIHLKGTKIVETGNVYFGTSQPIGQKETRASITWTQELGIDLREKMEALLTVSEFMMLRFEEIGLLRETKKRNIGIVEIAKLKYLWK